MSIYDLGLDLDDQMGLQYLKNMFLIVFNTQFLHTPA